MTDDKPACCREADDDQCAQHRQQERVLGRQGVRRHSAAPGRLLVGDSGKAKPPEGAA